MHVAVWLVIVWPLCSLPRYGMPMALSRLTGCCCGARLSCLHPRECDVQGLCNPSLHEMQTRAQMERRDRLRKLLAMMGEDERDAALGAPLLLQLL